MRPNYDFYFVNIYEAPQGHDDGNNMIWEEKLYFNAFMSEGQSFSGEFNRFVRKRKRFVRKGTFFRGTQTFCKWTQHFCERSQIFWGNAILLWENAKVLLPNVFWGFFLEELTILQANTIFFRSQVISFPSSCHFCYTNENSSWWSQSKINLCALHLYFVPELMFLNESVKWMILTQL